MTMRSDLLLSPALAAMLLLCAVSCGKKEKAAESDSGGAQTAGKVVVLPPKTQAGDAEEDERTTISMQDEAASRQREYTPFGIAKIERRKKNDSRTAASIPDLTAEILEESHERQFSKRPRPADFDLDSPDVKKYVEEIALTKPRAREKKRLELLGDVRTTIAKNLSKRPYSGKIKVKRKDGGDDPLVRTGRIVSAGKDGVLFQPKGAGDRVAYPWERLTPDTLSHIMEFHVRLQLKAKVRKAGASNYEKNRAAADDLLRAAILTDWYGDYKESKRLARIAVDIAPELEPLAESLFLD